MSDTAHKYHAMLGAGTIGQFSNAKLATDTARDRGRAVVTGLSHEILRSSTHPQESR